MNLDLDSQIALNCVSGDIVRNGMTKQFGVVVI